jgi:hypothetical protein
MTTDYKNLSLFEAAAVVMISVGIALVGFQVFISMPDAAQAKVAAALQVLEMSDAAQEIWAVEQAANDIVFNGMEEFLDGFYVALGEVAMPIAGNLEETAGSFTAAMDALNEVSEHIASNYQNNYVVPGVEGGMGGRVMGAYFEGLIE